MAKVVFSQVKSGGRLAKVHVHHAKAVATGNNVTVRCDKLTASHAKPDV